VLNKLPLRMADSRAHRDRKLFSVQFDMKDKSLFAKQLLLMHWKTMATSQTGSLSFRNSTNK